MEQDNSSNGSKSLVDRSDIDYLVTGFCCIKIDNRFYIFNLFFREHFDRELLQLGSVQGKNKKLKESGIK